MKILWRRSTETEIAFGERRSPAAVLHTVLHARLRAHGFLATRADFLLGAPEKCKESVFAPPILLQNQANPQILL